MVAAALEAATSSSELFRDRQWGRGARGILSVSRSKQGCEGEEAFQQNRQKQCASGSLSVRAGVSVSPDIVVGPGETGFTTDAYGTGDWHANRTTLCIFLVPRGSPGSGASH